MIQLGYILSTFAGINANVFNVVIDGTGANRMNINPRNPSVDLDQQCDQYTDCFNCTLSHCDWATSSTGTQACQ